MRFTGLLWRAGISLLLFTAMLASASSAARRPRYGGTLRVEIDGTSISFDPREWKAGSVEEAENEKVAALVLDRLVTLDNYGRFQPQLATEWLHDAEFKRWEFTLRAAAKFSDGAALTAADVAAALEPLLPAGRQIAASGNSVVIRSATPMPDLLEELSSGRYFVYRAQAAGGAFAGTGPFVFEKSETPTEAASGVKTTRMVFRANEECWAGRPFVDRVEVTLGVAPLRRLYDLQLGKAELIELTPDLVRRAAQAGLRTWSSTPVLLFALRFDATQAEAQDTRLREAFSLSLGRSTMASVLLQKQAEPAATLLPGWLSGYAFLFSVDMNPERAKEIRAALPANVASAAEPLRLRVDAPGDVAKLLGERVAVNARQAQLNVRVVNRSGARANAASATTDPPAGIRLISWHYSSLSAQAELEAVVAGLGLAETPGGPSAQSGDASSGAQAEQLYARERKILEDRRILPLVALPETVGIGATVRDWMASRWGEWHLGDVWLEQAEAPAADKPGAVPPAAANPPGAHP